MLQRLEDGKVTHRLDPKEAVLARDPKWPAGSARAAVASGAPAGAPQDQARGQNLVAEGAGCRAIEWKTSWLDLRIKYVTFLCIYTLEDSKLCPGPPSLSSRVNDANLIRLAHMPENESCEFHALQ